MPGGQVLTGDGLSAPTPLTAGAEAAPNMVTTDTAQLITGLKTFSPSAVGAVGLIVKGLVGQTGDLQQWQDSAGVVGVRVDSAGKLRTNNTMTAGGGGVLLNYLQDSAAAKGYLDLSIAGVNFMVENRVTTNVNLAVRAVAAQTADLFQCDNAGVKLLRVGPGGVGLNGNAPTAKAAAIASPTADVAALKTAVDAVRVALTNIGITA